MNIYLDCLMYIFSIITFQFIASPKLARVVYWEAINRNINYVENNPDILKEFPPHKSWYHYILGTIFILIIISGTILQQKKLNLMIHTMSAVFAMIYVILSGWWFDKKLSNKIPNPEKRKAILRPRRLSNYLPKWIIYLSLSFTVVFYVTTLTFYLLNIFDFNYINASLRPYLFLVVFLYSLIILDLKTSKPLLSRPIESETYLRATIQLCFSVVVAALVCGYYRITYKIFELDKLISINIDKYLFAITGLSIFIAYVVNQHKITKEFFKKYF